MKSLKDPTVSAVGFTPTTFQTPNMTIMTLVLAIIRFHDTAADLSSGWGNAFSQDSNHGEVIPILQHRSLWGKS